MTWSSRDPAQWMEDLSVHVDDEELLAYAATLEADVLSDRPRVLVAAWTVFGSAVAGAISGFAFGDAAWSSWLAFVAYLASCALVFLGLRWLNTRLVGVAGARRVLSAFFWSCALAIVTVAGARIETGWAFNVVVVGGGLVIGLMYSSLHWGPVRQRDAWLIAALPLGALATWSAAGLQRAFDATDSPVWAEAFVGTMAACVFIMPMALLGVLVSTRSNGLAKMAILYLHNDTFIPKAIENLDQAIALSPRSVDLYNLRGIAHSRLGQADRADADFATVAQLSPRAAEVHINRGAEFLRQGDFDRAVEALRLATRINPTLPMAHSNLGTAYQKKADFDAAIESYTRAISLRPKYPIAFANRAYAYFLKGEHERAIADASHAIALDPRLPMAHVNLGHALAAMGDVPAAAESFRRALSFSPDRSVTEEAHKALEKLGVPAAEEDDD